MRTSPATIVPITGSGARSFARRPLNSFFGQLTCLVLVKHHETDTIVHVSDDGDAGGAVTIAKAFLIIDPVDRGRFIVAQMSQTLANKNKLQPRFIDPEKLTADEAAYLAEAICVAARTRLRLRGFQQPLAYPGRNAFA